MIAQNQTPRARACELFRACCCAMTTDPAMLLWLYGSENEKEAPNENYAREMQELFTLGAGDGYTERDVREHARALTGFTNSWNQATGQPDDFHFDPTRHDAGVKVIFGQRGRFDWRTACGWCSPIPLTRRLRHQAVVLLLPEPLSDRGTTRGAEQLYVSHGQADPAGRARRCSMHPAWSTRPAHGQAADRADRRDAARHRPLDHRHRRWAWESGLAGQMPFYPPNVAGWEARSLAEHGDLARALQSPRRR